MIARAGTLLLALAWALAVAGYVWVLAHLDSSAPLAWAGWLISVAGLASLLAPLSWVVQEWRERQNLPGRGTPRGGRGSFHTCSLGGTADPGHRLPTRGGNSAVSLPNLRRL